jgi:NAD-dependent SIR2 family protein deacetylase
MHIFDNLNEFIQRHPGLFVLTGAGCSTDSGIPDYRNADGEWKHKPPVQYQDFIRSKSIRQRYWARSMVGWRAFAQARPNPAHFALARLEAAGFVQQLVTQNVDGLHQRAGSRRVIDLHGRLDAVACLDCHKRLPRADFQHTLVALNPDFEACSASGAPDGDALLEAVDFARFQIPACQGCGGILKPTVVFFGESVPRPRVQRAMATLEQAPALLVVGSSLTVFSGYRFCRRAAAIPIPMGAINLGRTRADGELALKIREPCGEALSKLVQHLGI